MNSQQRSTPERKLTEVDKPVLERWGRRARYRLAHEIARTYMRWKLPLVERKRQKALERAFEITKYHALKNKNGNVIGFPTLLILAFIYYLQIAISRLSKLMHLPTQMSGQESFMLV
jgi:hypothetical protein